MEKITIVKRVISVEGEPVELSVIDEGKGIYDSEGKDVVFSVNETPDKRCWRLVYSLKYGFTHFFESGGVTSSFWDMLCGTEAELREEAIRLGVIIPDDIEGMGGE